MLWNLTNVGVILDMNLWDMQSGIEGRVNKFKKNICFFVKFILKYHKIKNQKQKCKKFTKS